MITMALVFVSSLMFASDFTVLTFLSISGKAPSNETSWYVIFCKNLMTKLRFINYNYVTLNENDKLF